MGGRMIPKRLAGSYRNGCPDDPEIRSEQAMPAAHTPFLPVCVQAPEIPAVVHQGAITVSFRSGHQLVLHEATPDMLRQLVAALS